MQFGDALHPRACHAPATSECAPAAKLTSPSNRPTSQESRCESLAGHWLLCVRRNFLLFTQKFNAFARHASAGVFVLTLSHVRRGIPTAAAVFIPCVHALTQILVILLCSFGMWRIRVFGLRVRLGAGSIPSKEQCNCADDRERTHGTLKHPKGRPRGRATQLFATEGIGGVATSPISATGGEAEDGVWPRLCYLSTRIDGGQDIEINQQVALRRLPMGTNQASTNLFRMA
jgi:hypothetical protein